MSTKEKAAKSKPSMAQALASLAKLNKPALQKKYREVFGTPTKSDNVVNLRAAIARKIAREALKPVVAKIDAANANKAALEAKSRARDPRLPPIGSVIARHYNNIVHKVKVLDEGFEYRGERHRSLSSLAKLITGQVWNGYLFFSLIKRSKSASKSASAEARA